MVKYWISLILITTILSCNTSNKTSKIEDNLPDEVITDSIQLIQKSDSLKKLGYNVFTYKEANKHYLMQEYFMVQLLAGDNDSIPKEVLSQLQQDHLAYLSKMYDLGHASLIGPMNNGKEWRGIVVYNTPSLKMADSLANQDPLVKSGALKVKTTGWWTEKGGKLK